MPGRCRHCRGGCGCDPGARWSLTPRSARISRIRAGTDGAFAALSGGHPEMSSYTDPLSKANASSFCHCIAALEENGKREEEPRVAAAALLSLCSSRLPSAAWASSDTEARAIGSLHLQCTRAEFVWAYLHRWPREWCQPCRGKFQCS